MDNRNNFIQYQDCNLENMLALINDLFDGAITKNSLIADLCEDDIRKIDKIQKGISKRFGVHITIKNILNTETVANLHVAVKKLIESPNYPSTERDIRRNQLEQIANDKDLSSITGTLKSAGGQLNDSLSEIRKLTAPTDLIGHKTKYDWINKTLDFLDTNVSRDELKEVITKVDENNQNAFRNMGVAIGATNNWINAICEALIWIIQIENDLYDISEESSERELDISKILAKDGKNIEGLAEFSAAEKQRRLRIQQQIKDFKADVEGKIDFLNKVHQRLREKLDKQQAAFSTMQDMLDKGVEQMKHSSEMLAKEQKDFFAQAQEQTTNAFENIEKRQKDFMESVQNKQADFISQSKEQATAALKELEQKYKASTDNLKAEQQKSFAAVQDEMDRSIRQQQDTISKFEAESKAYAERQKAEMEHATTEFMTKQEESIAAMKKQVSIYKIVSASAIAISIASLLIQILV